MAKKKKEAIVLENVELKPQVIGNVLKKKTNMGRVIFIFICFILVVYYINDISVFINGLLGRPTAETIEGQVNNQTTGKNPSNNQNAKEIVYNLFSNTLSINEKNLIINNFNYANNKLTFDANNTTSNAIDLKDKKYFLETYTENKTLLQRVKIDFNVINPNSKISFSYDITSPFYYLVLVEKTVDDYPNVQFNDNNTGVINITCTKDSEQILYTFKDEKLTNIKHTITNNNINDADYNVKYNAIQNKVTSYNTINGINASFNSTLNGYSAIITIDVVNADLKSMDEKYYYNSETIPKVVNFEMQTYGFTCN